MCKRGEAFGKFGQLRVAALGLRAAHLDLAEPAPALDLHRQQPGGALLDQAAFVVGRGQPQFHRRPGRAHAGVAGEGQFHLGGEDAHVVAGAVVRRQEENGLGQIQPGGDGLHGGGVQAIGIDDHA
ncbi:hypothetical protein D3C71_1171230 [compost metagenome]